MQKPISEKDRKRAEFCLNQCSGCTGGRKNQKGFKFWVVKIVGVNVCPNCRAYAKVYGQKAYKPITR